ncbi:hypothetical protein DRQ53_07895 [bacterium]|nr:MAG: hypothetical protein DRQ53_07895 [bacterium]
MKKIAIGCGVTAAVVVAILIGAGVFGARWMKGQFHEAERYERISDGMVVEYGDPNDYTPPFDGNYDPNRVAIFASIRGQLEGVGLNLREETEDLAQTTDPGWWKGIRMTMRLLNAGAGYLATADSLLMDAGMSRGEYAHLQTAWLHSTGDEWPEDYADTQPAPEDEDEQSFDSVFEEMAEEYSDQASVLMQAHARNARDAAIDARDDCVDCPTWIEYLDGQLEATRNQRSHVAMLDPVPNSLALALEQHKYELDITRPRDHGSWLMVMLLVIELDDDGDDGIQFRFGE